MSNDRFIEAIKDLFRINLGVRKEERVLVFTDEIMPEERITPEDRNRRGRLKDLARLVAEVGKGLCKEVVYTEYKALMSHGAEPPEKVWRRAFGEKTVKALKELKVMKALIDKRAGDEQIRKAEDIISKYRKNTIDVVVGLSNYSTSHTRFRDFITRAAGARYASMPLFDPDMLFGAMTVDWRDLERRTKDLAGKVNKALRIEVSTPNGTELSFSKEGRKTGSDTGILRKPGSFGNLPAGEVYLAPLEGTSEGKLIVEWAPTHRLKYTVDLTVRKGKVVEVEGRDSYRSVLEKKLSENDNFRNIAELGIGTNDKATRPDNILESEKILGTIHIALGDNSSFGGKIRTPFHQDFIFFRPTLRLVYHNKKEAVILKDGRLRSL